MEQSCPRKEDRSPSRVNFDMRLYDKKFTHLPELRGGSQWSGSFDG